MMSHHYPRRTSNTRNQIERDHQISLPNLNTTKQNCSALKSDHFPVEGFTRRFDVCRPSTNTRSPSLAQGELLATPQQSSRGSCSFYNT
ncbi:Peroxisomal membrane protein [Dorcoceras hygrometricum]|uniref:Peroxisomal membrane protein n=1 Tax=Dorcoceras hygrometricum TaxID=472368 RepID=A0A2Z7CX38_9LAMI|nr:Peroxisomal membrane protein [Dorcoceras hygrometricum]